VTIATRLRLEASARYVGVAALALAACDPGGGAQTAAGDDAAVGVPSPDAGAVTALVGEVHLHQFPGGTHAWTSFVAQNVPVDAARKDSITDVYTAATSQEGPCALYVAPTCTTACLGSTFCYAPDTCQALPTWKYIDGGQVQVTGSSLVPLIRMWWDASSSGYDSQPAPGAPQLFAGGDILDLAGGAGDFAFEQRVAAPNVVTLMTPDPSTDLHLMPGPLAVTWVSDVSDTIEILVTSQATSGASAAIRCVTTDTGALTIPGDMVNALPPPPRQTSFQILRNNIGIVPVARPGAGIFVHVAQTTWVNGVD
jgi:hypothetical protein